MEPLAIYAALRCGIPESEALPFIAKILGSRLTDSSPRGTIPDMIRIHNYSTHRYRGLVNCMVDGRTGSPLARDIGCGVSQDFWVDLAPNQGASVDPQPFEDNEPLPPESVIAQQIGGPVLLDGAPMSFVGAKLDDAAILGHWALRSGGVLVEVWLRYWPGHPMWCAGEALVTFSDRSTPNLTTGWSGKISVGNAICSIYGAGWNGQLCSPTTSWGDGQARLIPFTCIWPHLFRDDVDMGSAIAFSRREIHAVDSDIGVTATGKSSYRGDFRVADWARAHLQRAVECLHSWDPPSLGIAPDSGQSGDQEELTETGGEGAYLGLTGYPSPVGAWVRYLAACAYSHFPCHHLDGIKPVSKASNPTALFYYGRPMSISPDKLGKPLPDDIKAHTNGWSGPDNHGHYAIQGLFAAAALTSSPGVQKLLAHHAEMYPLQATLQPGWATTGIFQLRQIGYELRNAPQFWLRLEDRELAGRVRAHAINRMRQVILPWIGTKLKWEIRELPAHHNWGAGRWWLAWQQAFAAYYLDVAGEVFDIPEARSVALAGAQHIWEKCFEYEGGWIEYVGLTEDETRRQRYHPMRTAWLPMALATLLRRQPSHPCLAAWNQLRLEATDYSWFPNLGPALTCD